jgi:DHA1 family bicyclomycin/chloramphenicol resistance-like MFS transporter
MPSVPPAPAAVTSSDQQPATTVMPGGLPTSLLVLLAALAACGPISTDMYLPSLPALAASFGVSANAAQTTLTTYLIGFAVGMLVYGPLSDAYGRRPVLLAGVALFFAASGACAAAPTLSLLLVARFLQALGAGAASVLVRTIARDAAGPLRSARVLSMMATVTAVGPLIAPTLGGQLLLLGGWRLIFVVLTTYGGISLLAVWRRIPETWPAHVRGGATLRAAFEAYGGVLTDPIAWGYLVCGGMCFTCLFAYITGTPFVYINYYHVAPQHYGLFFALNIAGLMSANLVNARLVGRLGTQTMIGCAALATMLAAWAVAVICLAGVGGLPALVVALLVVVGMNGVIGANCMNDMMHRYPGRSGAAAALFGACQFGLGSLGSLAVGVLNDGTPHAMGVVIGTGGTLAFAGFMLIRRQTRIGAGRAK